MDRREAFASITAGIAALIGIREKQEWWEIEEELYDPNVEIEPEWWQSAPSQLPQTGFFNSGKSVYMSGIGSLGIMLVNDYDYYLTFDTDSIEKIENNCECWDIQHAWLKTDVVDTVSKSRLDFYIDPCQITWKNVYSEEHPYHVVAVTLSNDDKYTPLTFHRLNTNITGGDITVDFGDGKISSIL